MVIRKALVALILLPATSFGQTGAQAGTGQTLAIRARRIETSSKGVMENGVILIRDGKITAVGTDTRTGASHTVTQGVAITFAPGATPAAVSGCEAP